MVDIRVATLNDVPVLVELLGEYMRELFGVRWHGSAEALARDLGSQLEMIVVERDRALDGFAAFRITYDLHHCLRGGEVMDLYVRPSLRGRGVALQLVASVAAAVHVRGGAFVKGQAVGAPTTRRLYERVAMAFEGADCIVGGRAFRTLAALSGKPARAVIKGLPDKRWNFEP